MGDREYMVGDGTGMNRDEMEQKLRKTLIPKRFQHSLNVMEEAGRLAAIYGVNPDQAALAGLLHDCAKCFPAEQAKELCQQYGLQLDPVTLTQAELIHGPLGAEVARREYRVEDPEVLQAIYWHTVGKARMSPLEKIIFIADYTEPARSFPGVEEIRACVAEDMDQAIIKAVEGTLLYVISRGWMIHPNTVYARNALLMERT